MHILVAEDNRVNQLVARRMLLKLGQTADFVEDGEAAVKQVQAAPYDLVLMDVHMPAVDGLEATRRIRALPAECSKITVIALTASATADDYAACLGVGMNDYLTKPLSLVALQQALSRWGPRQSTRINSTRSAEGRFL